MARYYTSSLLAYVADIYLRIPRYATQRNVYLHAISLATLFYFIFSLSYCVAEMASLSIEIN